MSARNEEAKGPHSIRQPEKWLAPEPPIERFTCELTFSPVLEDHCYRRIDDAIGQAPPSQFVRHPQASASTPEQQLLGTASSQRGVIDITEITQCSKGIRHRLGRETATRQMRPHLLGRARGSGQITVGDLAGERIARARIAQGLRSERS